MISTSTESKQGKIVPVVVLKLLVMALIVAVVVKMVVVARSVDFATKTGLNKIASAANMEGWETGGEMESWQESVQIVMADSG